MTRDELKVDSIYRYGPGGWCRHGMCRIEQRSDGKLVAYDTYWSSDMGEIDIDEHLPNMEFLFDLNVGTHEVSREDYETYAEGERLFLPIGGSRERCLVYSAAVPIPARLAGLLRRKIQDHRYSIQIAINAIARLSIELHKVEAAIETERPSPAEVCS